MKRTLSILLLLALCVGFAPAALAFEDVADFAESAAAESLASLGIVDSVEYFNPKNYLTRAQFCKIATLAAGFDEHSLYSGYTIYPDVAASTWYAPYVNAAVRKYGIIKGDEHGYFNPAKNISYGEAVTILLRMLGYTTADIGLLWPNDYVNKAEAIGLNGGMQPHSANQAITRGQAAILLCNALLSETKDGSLYLAATRTTGSEDTILFATAATDSMLRSDQVMLYQNGETTTYGCNASLSADLCGLRGIPVFHGRTQNRLQGFVADLRNAEIGTVSAVSANALTLKSGTVNVPRDTLTMAGGLYGSYVTCWFDIRPDDEAALYYGSNGVLELIAVRSRTASASGSTYVYGIDTLTFGKNDRLIKDGAEISRSDLADYDVLTYSPKDSTWYVSSDRITLLYQSGGPVYTNPSRITAGNRTFTVTEQAGRYFAQKGVALGSCMTLLFDYNGQLAAVQPTSKVKGEATGILRELSESGCRVELLSGMTLEGTPDFSIHSKFNADGQRLSNLYKLEGQLVTVSQDKDGLLEIREVKSAAVSGDLDLNKTALGRYALSPTVRVYESAAKGLPLHEIALADLTAHEIDSSRILHTTLDDHNRIATLVLQDVTGDRFLYGMAQVSTEEEVYDYDFDGEPMLRTRYTISIRTGDGEQTCKTLREPDLAVGRTLTPAAVAADLAGESVYTPSAPAFPLACAGTVERSAFDAGRRVILGNTYVDLADDLVIYSLTTRTFVPTLAEARANYSEFHLYLDRPAEEGGTVRVITVE